MEEGGSGFFNKFLEDILQDSLWARTLARRTDEERAIQRRLLQERARFIWRNSTSAQRRGYFAAGVSFATGTSLESKADTLNHLLFLAEQGIEQRDQEAVIEAVLQLADIVFQIPPFAPRDALPSGWQDVVRGWMEGRPMAEIVASDPEEIVEFIEDAIVYRLVWAVEAIRVRSKAHQDNYADLWSGRLAEALEAGTMDRCAVILIHAGLGSRIAALSALEAFAADFTDYQGMKEWLRSQPLVDATHTADWPTAETAELWRRFVDSVLSEGIRPWTTQGKKYLVNWIEGVTPVSGSLVRLVRQGATRTEVASPDYAGLGVLKYALPMLEGVVFGIVTDSGEVEVTYHGPNKLK